jgi:hypothetical protein
MDARINPLTILQPNGVEAIHPIGVISGYELKLVQAAIPELATSIDKVSRSALDWFALTNLIAFFRV